jgi:chromosome segregation ATPase
MGDMTARRKNPATEDIWAMFRESSRQLQETGRRIKAEERLFEKRRKEADQRKKEIDQEMKEIRQRMKETDRQMQETRQQMKETDRQMKETDRQMKETDRRLGDLGSRLGEVIEHIMTPKLHEKFEALGYCFNHSSRNHELRDQNKKRLAEIDILLENGNFAMAVEVKTRLRTEHVKDHVKRMEILRRVADAHDDRRKYLGAVAGAVVDQQVMDYALKNGFYVIIPSGDTVNIEAPKSTQLRVW